MCQAGIDCPDCPSPRSGAHLRHAASGRGSCCAACGAAETTPRERHRTGPVCRLRSGRNTSVRGPIPVFRRTVPERRGTTRSGRLWQSADVHGGLAGIGGTGHHANVPPARQCLKSGISRFQKAAPDCPEGRTPVAARGSRSPFPAGPEHSGCFCLPGSPPQGPRP